MPSKPIVWLIVVIAAVVFVLTFLVQGIQTSTAILPLKYISLAVGITFFLLEAYDKFLWKLSLVRFFTHKPLIHGTWKGELQSSYLKKPIQVVVMINQTNSSISLRLYTKESWSASMHSRLSQELGGPWNLDWSYANQPNVSVLEKSGSHRGNATLRLAGDQGSKLIGEYFTDRKTRGEIKLTSWSKTVFYDFDSAFEASAFKVPKPFSGKMR